MEQVKPYIKILHCGDRIEITLEPQGNKLLTVQRDDEAMNVVTHVVELLSKMTGPFEVVTASDWVEGLGLEKWTTIRDRLLDSLEREE